MKLQWNPFKYADALGILKPGGQLSDEMSAKNDGWLTDFHNKKAPLIVASIFGGMAAGGAFGGGAAAGGTSSGGLAGLGGAGATTAGSGGTTAAASSTPAWLKYGRLGQLAMNMGQGGGGGTTYGPPQHQFVGEENPYTAMLRRRMYG